MVWYRLDSNNCEVFNSIDVGAEVKVIVVFHRNLLMEISERFTFAIIFKKKHGMAQKIRQ